jgi:hypothetical protein
MSLYVQGLPSLQVVSLGRFVTVQPPVPLQTELAWHAPGVQV